MRLSLILFLSLCYGSILLAQAPKDTVIDICHTYIYFGSNEAVLDTNAQMKYPNPKNEEEQKANRRVEIVIRECDD